VNRPLLGILNPRMRLGGALKVQQTEQWLPRRELDRLQLERLRALLKHAWENCPYYRQTMQRAGLTGGRIDGLEDFRRLPLVTKRDIQRHRDEMIAQNFNPSHLVPNHTGGSTGDPLHFFNDHGENLRMRGARQPRGDMWAGWKAGKRTVRLWGAGVDVGKSRSLKARLLSWVLNDHLLDCLTMDEDVIARHIDFMRRFRAQIIVSYTTIAYLFATKLRESGMRLPHLESVICSAEVLTGSQREVIESGFDRPVFNRYGCREFGLVAAECGLHSGMHVGIDQVVLEVVDDAGEPVDPHEMGNIVITDLFNHGMPFIRYSIEDMGVMSDEPCRCGRGLPLLTEVAGRESDIIRMPSGRRVACLALMCGFAKDLSGVKNLQLVRYGPTRFTMRILKGPAYKDEELAYLQHHLPAALGSEAEISYEFVDQVERTPSGKYRFLVSELPSDGVK